MQLMLLHNTALATACFAAAAAECCLGVDPHRGHEAGTRAGDLACRFACMITLAAGSLAGVRGRSPRKPEPVLDAGLDCILQDVMLLGPRQAASLGAHPSAAPV